MENAGRPAWTMVVAVVLAAATPVSGAHFTLAIDPCYSNGAVGEPDIGV